MGSVYDEENYAGRVNYAATVIARKGRHTRHFDTTCEMDDGDFVVVAVYRRSLSNPNIAKNIFDYFNKKITLDLAEKYKDVLTSKLKDLALEARQAADARRKQEAAASKAASLEEQALTVDQPHNGDTQPPEKADVADHSISP